MRTVNLTKSQVAFVAGLGLATMIALPQSADSAPTGPCSDCHTMHYSQDGQVDGVDLPLGGPFEVLLKGDCLSCHTGPNDGGSKPYIYDTGAVTYGPGANGSLAGGNFKWVATDDTAGHNISFLANEDSLTAPPGWDQTNTWLQYKGFQTDMTAGDLYVTCAGTAGCHGERTYGTNTNQYAAIRGSHHEAGTVNGTSTGPNVGRSYRFLKDIKGMEDSDWEYTAAPDDHNGYYAMDRYDNTGGSDAISDTQTISALCAQCHGGFHNSSGVDANWYANGGDRGIMRAGASPTMSSPWVRHPTDVSLPQATNTEEYFYNVDGTVQGEYNHMVPVGSTSHDDGGTLQTNPTTATSNDRIVICLSCHRAHGSPYADLLRWDYATMTVGSTTNDGEGCFVCHNTKDA